ncbi:MAG: cytochrome c oxidase assembly protein [Jatrophihabitans sp.]|nr:MAG: cytochrome c oxidase assembly protein [Jatrophihabitans sp.]
MPPTGSQPPRARRRVPPLALAAWLVAAALTVLVGLAVAAHWDSASSMAGMHMHSAGDALTRAGGSPAGPLLGWALFTKWQLDAIAVAALVVVTAAYLTGVALVPLRTPGARWPVGRTVSFLAGVAVTGYATCGAIAVYDQALFTAHMCGHLALVMLAPALFVGGSPLRLAIDTTPPRVGRWLARVATGRVLALLTAPPVALATYTAVIVGSHLTGIMDVIMRNTWAGQVEHLVYLVVGWQFFVLVVGDEPIRWRLASPARWLILAVGMAVDTFTGIVLMQGNRAIEMVATPGVFVDRLADTRTGGAIMWFGGDGLMAAVMLVLVITWLRNAGTERAEPSGWLEQARRAAFHDAIGTGTDEDVDEDDAARASYNAWLQKLDRSG